MTPLPYGFDHLNAARAHRQDVARTLYRHLLREAFGATPRRVLAGALRDTTEEAGMYALLLGEVMPPHLRDALDLERDLWTYLLRIREAPAVPPDNVADLCERLTPVVRTLDELLSHERAMLTNPLVTRYEQCTTRLRVAARNATTTEYPR
jgi:hypothetical protein